MADFKKSARIRRVAACPNKSSRHLAFYTNRKAAKPGMAAALSAHQTKGRSQQQRVSYLLAGTSLRVPRTIRTLK